MGFEIENGVLKKYTEEPGVTEVVIPEGVTSIGAEAFEACGNLTNVTIPDGVASIGDCAFHGCSSLISIAIPDGVTSIGDGAFSDCSSLTSITIPGSVTSIGDEAFEACGKLTSVTLPDSVTSISNRAFLYCRSLTSIVIPNRVMDIGAGAFSYCRNLKSIVIPDGVTNIGDETFWGCKKLADTEGFVIVKGVLYNYYGTSKKVVVPGGVTSIGDKAFSGCKELTSVTIPNSVTSIGDWAFSHCSSLTSITIPDSVTSIGGGVFHNCSSLTSITIPGGVTSIGDVAFKDCSSLTSVTLPGGVTSVGDESFEECEQLADFTCPSSLAKRLSAILPKTKHTIVLHIEDITDVSAKYRPGAAVGFAEDGRDCTDENEKKYCKYIKSNAAKLVELAIAHPALLYLMLREKLIAAKDLNAVTAAVQNTGNAELIAAVLNYGNSAVSEQDKKKVRQKKDQRETNVTNFIFDAEKLEALKGKTFVVTGKLKTFVSRDELKECLTACGAALTETLSEGVDYLITNTPDAGTAKNKKAVELGLARITEAQFNDMIGRKAEG